MRSVETQMEKNPGKSVVEIRVKIGRYLFADLDVFTSAWNLITQDTPLSNAKLTVESADGRECALSGVIFTD
jgi:Zn finger protein HypA/HybF involved in hydrogenase expression